MSRKKRIFTKYIKGALCSFGEEIQTQNFNIYNTVIIQSQNIYLYLNKPAVLRGKNGPQNTV